MRRRIVFSGLALLLGAVAALGIGESLLRAMHLEGDQFFVPDRWLGWVHRAGFRGTYVSKEVVREGVQVNDRGLLGPNRSYARRESVRRLLLVGDSYTESMQVPFERTWGDLLEKALGPDWEAINGGVAGYGIDNTLLALRREYVKYHPDIVFLLFFTGNDVSDNDAELYAPERSSRPKPYFTLEPTGALRLHDSPMPIARGPKQRLKHELRQRSHLYRFAKDRIHEIRTRRAYTAGSVRAVPRPWYVYSREPDEDFARAWLTTRALIRELRREVEGRGALLVGGILPTDWRVEPDRLAEVLAECPSMTESSWDFDLPDRMASETFAELGIPFVNLTPALKEARSAADVPLYSDHLTEAGHRVVAAQLARFFEESVIPRLAGTNTERPDPSRG